MPSPSVFWRISAAWVSLTILMALLNGASSAPGWMLVTIIGVVPPLILLNLWSDGPPPTVAEVLHATELKR
jgi:hypothetical protein